MMNRMVGSVLTLMMLLFSAEAAVAQTYTQMQWGMNKGVIPYQFGANINGSWTNLGTVSPSGVWQIPNTSISDVLKASNNLSDLASITTAQTNIRAPLSPPYPNTIDAWCSITTTAGSANITLSGCNVQTKSAGFTGTWSGFTSADVGKLITIYGPGPTEQRLTTSIVAVTNSTNIVTAAPATQTMTAITKQVFFGSDQYAALQAVFTLGQASGQGSYVRAGHYLTSAQLSCLPPNSQNNWNYTAAMCQLDPGATISAMAAMNAVIQYGAATNYTTMLRSAVIYNGTFDGNFLAQYGQDFPFFLHVARIGSNTKNTLHAGVHYGSTSAPASSAGTSDYATFHEREIYGVAISSITAANPAVVTTSYDHGISAGRVVWIARYTLPSVNAAGTGYGASVSGKMTWAGAGCSVNPVFNVTTNGSGAISGVTSVDTIGECSSWPSSAASTWTPSSGLSAGSGVTFNLNQYMLRNKWFRVESATANTLTLANVDAATNDGTTWGAFSGTATVYMTMPTMDVTAPVYGLTTLGATTVEVRTWTHGYTTGDKVFIADTFGYSTGGNSCVDGEYTITVTATDKFTIEVPSTAGCSAYVGSGFITPWHGDDFESAIFFDNATDGDVHGIKSYGTRFGIYSNPLLAGWDGKVGFHHYNYSENGETLAGAYLGGTADVTSGQQDCPARYAFWFFGPYSKVTASSFNNGACTPFPQRKNYSSFIRLDKNASASVTTSTMKGDAKYPNLFTVSSPVAYVYGYNSNYQQNNTISQNTSYSQPAIFNENIYTPNEIFASSITTSNTLTAIGGVLYKTRAITTASNVSATDYIIQSNGASGVPTFPTAVGITGQVYIFKNNSGGSITPATTSSQTIDGAAPAAIANKGVLRIYSDGANWQSW